MGKVAFSGTEFHVIEMDRALRSYTTTIMNESSSWLRRAFSADESVWFLFAAAKLLIHLGSGDGYGFFRDELYFIDCGRHVDWGYVDHAPLVGWVTWLSLTLFGDSIFGLRLFPLLAGVAKIVLAGWLAREIGGGRFAQAVACLCLLIGPIFMASDSMMDIITFEQLWWLTACCILARFARTESPALLLGFGVAAGLGLLTKHSFVFFCFSTVAALLLTPLRRHLRSAWFWGAVGIITLFGLPNLIWQAAHGFPTLAFLQATSRHAHRSISAGEFLLGQFLYHHPLSTIIAILGLVFFFSERGRPHRLFAWIFLVTLALFLILKAKVYYLSPLYPPLLAGGAMWLESATATPSGFRFLRPALILALVLTGALLAPLFLPILPYPAYQNYFQVVIKPFPNLFELKQIFADRFGWENQVQVAARVYHSLAPNEREHCMIGVANYGEAGAVNCFGSAYGLPKAICGDMSYHLWGPGDADNRVAIVYGAGNTRDRLLEMWDEVEQAALIHHDRAPEWENDLPVFVCRRPKHSLQEIWPEIRTGF